MPSRDRALSFGQAAERYDRIRPSYPTGAIRWAVGRPPARVVDLGAGTGILTRALLAAGHDAVPVEPDPAMRERLTATTPGARARAGSAEDVPLPDGGADAVVAGQAYHWFDRDRAHPEVARVLRPGGVFAPMWNLRDESVDWVAELTRVAGMPDGSGHTADDVTDFGPLFGPLERAEFRHRTTHTPSSLVELVSSRSYYLTAPPDRRAELEAAVRELTAAHPRLAGRDTFELPYVTVVYRARRR
jgi:SAM-dependent methyltransferase